MAHDQETTGIDGKRFEELLQEEAMEAENNLFRFLDKLIELDFAQNNK